MRSLEKGIRPGSADRDAFATVWLIRCGVIYRDKYSTGYINVKLNVGGFARAGRPRKAAPTGFRAAFRCPLGIYGFGVGGWGGGLGGGGGERLVVEGEVLRFVVEDRAKESAVIGGAIRGNFLQQEMDAPGCCGRQSFCGVLGGEGGVITLDGGTGRGRSHRAGGKMEGHLRFDFERGAEVDGGRGGARGRLCGQIGQA